MTTQTGTVEILGIRTVGCHGRGLLEQHRPQPFEVDLRLDADLAPSTRTSSREDTIDYALVIEAVARTVELQSFPLLEVLANRIAGICLSLTAVTSAEVTVRKLRPQVRVHVASVGVTVLRKAPAEPARDGTARAFDQTLALPV